MLDYLTQDAYHREQDLLAKRCAERWEAHDKQHELEATAFEKQDKRLIDLENFKNNLTGRLVIINGLVSIFSAIVGGLVVGLVAQLLR